MTKEEFKRHMQVVYNFERTLSNVEEELDCGSLFEGVFGQVLDSLIYLIAEAVNPTCAEKDEYFDRFWDMVYNNEKWDEFYDWMMEENNG